MIFGIIILFSVSLVHGQLQWWQIPEWYLTNTLTEPDLYAALDFASTIDPEFIFDYKETVQMCYNYVYPPIPPLNIHQAAAIACYTTGTLIELWINQALRSLNVRLLIAWTPYLKFFHTGVAMLPAVPIYDFCRGDSYDFPVRELGSYYMAPLPFSNDIDTCRSFTNPPDLCTITKLISPDTKYIDTLSFYSQTKYIVLPGVLAKLVANIPQTATECRILILYTISATRVPRGTLVTSLLPPQLIVPHTTNVTNLLNANLNSTEIGQWNRFSKNFLKPNFLVRVHKTKHLNISTAGGYDHPNNSWPYITNITHNPIYLPMNLRVGQILVGVNGHNTYGMRHDQVEQLVMNAKMDQTNYTDYTVADP